MANCERSKKNIDMEKKEEVTTNICRDTLRIKQGVYTICFVLFCLIDQIVGSATGRVQHTAVNCSGFLIAIIIFTGCHWKDFIRLPYLLWTICSVIGGSIAVNWGRQNYDGYGKWVTAVINVIIYGYLVIRIFMRICEEKKAPRLKWSVFGVWVVMMLAMVFSDNDSVWPVWYLVMFGCFYLTEFTREELNALFNGMLNGIIIGFCILQSFATMFRAFDTLRYTGMYTNANMYALFCLIVHAAILGKWYQFKRNGASPIWSVLAGLGSGILMAYCFLAIGRAAMIVMCFNTVLLIALFFFQEKGKRFLKASGRLAAVMLSAILMFPAVFFSVRVIPASFSSAMVLTGDPGNKIQGMVHSWDDRYIEMDEFLEAALGRLFWFLFPKEAEEDDADFVGRVCDFWVPSLKVYAAEESREGNLTVAEKKPWGSGLEREDPVLSEKDEMSDPVKVRWAIYKTYLGRLNLKGHRNCEDGVWVTAEGYFAPHAHNFLLQIMFSFGIPAGVLFLLLAVAVVLCCLMRCLDKAQGNWFFVVGVFMITSFVGFGVLEIDWRLGQLSFLAFFVVQYLLLHKCGEENEKTFSLSNRGRKWKRLVLEPTSEKQRPYIGKKE